jgi:allophanate hydrolase subunit 2
MLNVLDGGLQTTVQDAGRFSWYHIGMPPAGAMDQYSFRVGNMLVGNPRRWQRSKSPSRVPDGDD